MRVLRVSVVLLVCLCVRAMAQQSMSVDTLVGFLRSTIQQKQPDKQVAPYVSRLRLTQKLPDSVIEELQSEGLGPNTVAALRKLSAATANLPAPAPEVAKKVETSTAVVPLTPASPEEQKKALDDAREYALNYSKSLPNFICLQVTKRYGDPTGAGNYRLYDTLNAKLTYFEQKEKYETLAINDKYTTQSYDSIGGSISTGEFGSMLVGIFEPQTAAEFTWSRWGKLHGHKTHVFSYSVDQPHSRWQIEDRQTKQHIVPAYTGLVWVDANDHTVLRFTLTAVDLPKTFSIQEADSMLDYDTVEISGVPFVLPAMATMHLKSGREDQKNEITFRAYHKYSADTNLKFDDIVVDSDKPAAPKK